MRFDKKLVILIDNETRSTEQLRQAIKEADPAFHCLSFQFADEAIFAMQAGVLHLPQYIFLDLDESTA